MRSLCLIKSKNVNFTFLRKKCKDYLNVCSASSEYKVMLNVSFLVDLFSGIEIEKFIRVHLNALEVNKSKKDRKLAMAAVIHTCNISHFVKDLFTALTWLNIMWRYRFNSYSLGLAL